MKAATRRRLRGRHVSSRLSYIRMVCLSTAVLSTGTLLRKLSSPRTFNTLAREPNGLLVVDIFFFLLNRQKSTKHELKARSDVLGPRLTYIPRPTRSMLGQPREGGGGSPHPSPSYHVTTRPPPRSLLPCDHVSWLVIGPSTLPRDLWVSIKTPPLHSKSARKKCMADKISPEAAQILQRLGENQKRNPRVDPPVTLPTHLPRTVPTPP